MHPTARHSATDCREIQKLTKRVSGRREQSSKDGSPPPHQRPGKEKASDSGTEENFRTESVQFDVAEVNLPFNAIIGRPALYRFMAIAHYGYLVLKMPSPAGVLTVRGDRTAAVAAVERLHALAAEAARSEEDPSTSQARAPA